MSANTGEWRNVLQAKEVLLARTVSNLKAGSNLGSQISGGNYCLGLAGPDLLFVPLIPTGFKPSNARWKILDVKKAQL